MDIIGDRRYVEIPGSAVYELPPLIHICRAVTNFESVMKNAQEVVNTDGIIPYLFPDEPGLEQRKFELAINLVEAYKRMVIHWRWGNDILEWIHQCETTFETKPSLRLLLRADVWPHAGRSSFVQLLTDKAVSAPGIELQKAVGLRLTFRQPPEINCFSDQFLLYLNETVGQTAFEAWSNLHPAPIHSLPPERFEFKVVDMEL